MSRPDPGLEFIAISPGVSIVKVPRTTSSWRLNSCTFPGVTPSTS